MPTMEAVLEEKRRRGEEEEKRRRGEDEKTDQCTPQRSTRLESLSPEKTSHLGVLHILLPLTLELEKKTEAM
jgi:hypothetical protein